MQLIAGTIVFAFAAFLIGLAIVSFTKRPLAERFLKSFASSARAHYTEHALRLLAGAGLVIHAPQMWLGDGWRIFGWFIVATSIILLCIPWQWHHRFGKLVIPLAIRYLPIHAIGAFALGVFILVCMVL